MENEPAFPIAWGQYHEYNILLELSPLRGKLTRFAIAWGQYHEYNILSEHTRPLYGRDIVPTLWEIKFVFHGSGDYITTIYRELKCMPRAGVFVSVCVIHIFAIIIGGSWEWLISGAKKVYSGRCNSNNPHLTIWGLYHDYAHFAEEDLTGIDVRSHLLPVKVSLSLTENHRFLEVF